VVAVIVVVEEIDYFGTLNCRRFPIVLVIVVVVVVVVVITVVSAAAAARPVHFWFYEQKNGRGAIARSSLLIFCVID